MKRCSKEEQQRRQEDAPPGGSAIDQDISIRFTNKDSRSIPTTFYRYNKLHDFPLKGKTLLECLPSARRVFVARNAYLSHVNRRSFQESGL
jgi:hypothetical protein